MTTYKIEEIHEHFDSTPTCFQTEGGLFWWWHDENNSHITYLAFDLNPEQVSRLLNNKSPVRKVLEEANTCFLAQVSFADFTGHDEFVCREMEVVNYGNMDDSEKPEENVMWSP